MFRLAHISDVHLGPLPGVTYRELASKRVVGYVNWQRNRRRHMHD
ncbi:metallophosphoesterase, partial [Mesorhizobium sp. M4A.F.Ca.ET.022.05.2.1]